jgi:hypothetical protein
LTLTHASSAPCFRMSCSRKKKVRLCCTCCRTCEHKMQPGGGGAWNAMHMLHRMPTKADGGTNHLPSHRSCGSCSTPVPSAARPHCKQAPPCPRAPPPPGAVCPPVRRPPRSWGLRSGGCRWGTCAAPPHTRPQTPAAGWPR